LAGGGALVISSPALVARRAFLVDADEFAWALPLGVAGLPAVLAVFPGLGFLLARLIWTPALAVSLPLPPDKLHGMAARACLTGFPWNTFAWRSAAIFLTRATGFDRWPLRPHRDRHPHFFCSAVLGEKAAVRGAWRASRRQS